MSQPAAGVPPHVDVIRMSTGFWVSGLVYTMAKLGLADRLAAGPLAAVALAADLGLQPRTLHRFMRTLASLGLLTQHADDRFELTAHGETLRTGAPGSARATVLTMASPMIWQAFGDVEYSLRTGLPAIEKVLGMNMFEHLAQHPDEAALFSESMVGIHGGEPPAVADAYDFSSFGTIVDVGGATGNMLGHILSRHPQPKGVLFDRPHVVGEAPALLAKHGVSDRVRIEPGDFFARVPEGGDAYILSHIIHDWTEGQCQTILGNCRRAMRPGAKLLIVEFVLPDGGTPHFGKLADMVMLTCPGGEERTADEYRTLLASSGLSMTRVVPTASDVSVVEAELA